MVSQEHHIFAVGFPLCTPVYCSRHAAGHEPPHVPICADGVLAQDLRRLQVLAIARHYPSCDMAKMLAKTT